MNYLRLLKIILLLFVEFHNVRASARSAHVHVLERHGLLGYGQTTLVMIHHGLQHKLVANNS